MRESERERERDRARESEREREIERILHRRILDLVPYLNLPRENTTLSQVLGLLSSTERLCVCSQILITVSHHFQESVTFHNIWLFICAVLCCLRGDKLLSKTAHQGSVCFKGTVTEQVGGHKNDNCLFFYLCGESLSEKKSNQCFMSHQIEA